MHFGHPLTLIHAVRRTPSVRRSTFFLNVSAVAEPMKMSIDRDASSAVVDGDSIRIIRWLQVVKLKYTLFTYQKQGISQK